MVFDSDFSKIEEDDDAPVSVKKMIRSMTKAEIVKLYSEGERDFSDILAPNSVFSGMNLSGIVFSRAKLINSSFKNCNLAEADFSSAEVQDTSFEGSDLTGADLSGAELTSCAFDSTILRNANLSKANMYWSRISGAIMEAANLKEANLSWCDISGTDFSGCDLSKANVQWALALKSKFSNDQFFGMSPDVLLTVRFAPPDAGGDGAKRTFSGVSLNPYVVADSGAAQYVGKSENIGAYSESSSPSSTIGAYSPKKKDVGGYRS